MLLCFRGKKKQKTMKKALFTILIVSLFISCNEKPENKAIEDSTPDLAYDESQKETNDFYDDAETYELKGVRRINVGGEISNPGIIDIQKLPVHSIIVKEAILAGNSNCFIGAYRYDGYSLYDILNSFKLDKKNAELFKPIIDLYIIIENDKGEKTLFSWGEIYYPVNRHNIIIATRVARIVPSKSKDLWPLPENTKIVVAHDLLTERNISDPVKITVVSYDIDLEDKKGLKPLYAPEISLFEGNESVRTLEAIPEGFEEIKYETVFYGRGRGIHSTSPFKGYFLKEILKENFTITQQNILHGIILISAPDGYRSVFTFSEIFNRNDQSEILLIDDKDNMDGGAFRLFPACDFFSDRAIKAVNGIYFKIINP